MPSFTFLNLSEERRNLIIQISLEEFAQHSYESASVSRIVKKVGVAKGSFYRYFRNKLDLYKYLVEITSTLQLEKVSELFDKSDTFFDVLVQNYYLRIKFDIDYPLHGKFLQNILQERNSQQLGNMMLKTKRQMMETVKGLVEKYQFKGAIRSDLQREWLAFQIIHTQYGISDYLNLYLTHTGGKKTHARNLSQLTDDELLPILKGFASILVDGMGVEQEIPSRTPSVTPAQQEG